MKYFLPLLFVIAIGCGDDSESLNTGTPFDNVSACENWVEALSCGDYDFGSSVSCESYRNVTTCDISDYFDCLTDNTSCDTNTGIPDFSNWQSCTPLATCT